MKLKIQTYEIGIEPITILLYGPHKIGKTTFASTAPKPLFITSERGLSVIGKKKPKFIQVKSYKDILAIVQAFKENDSDVKGYETLVIDSLTEIAETIEDELRQKHSDRILQQRDWGIYKDQLQTTIRELAYQMPINIIVIAHQEIVKDGEEINIIRPMVSGQLKEKIGQYFSIICHLNADVKGNRFFSVRNNTKYEVGCRYDMITENLPMDFSTWFVTINEGLKQKTKKEEKSQIEINTDWIQSCTKEEFQEWLIKEDRKKSEIGIAIEAIGNTLGIIEKRNLLLAMQQDRGKNLTSKDFEKDDYIGFAYNLKTKLMETRQGENK